MNAATILIILLSHQGCWFGGDANQISLQWSVQAAMPAADLRWEVFVGNLSIASGQAPMLPNPQKTIVQIQPPDVRVRTAMRWTYRLTAHDGGKELDWGEKAIDVFPESITDGLARRVGKSRVVVWEQDSAIGDLFDRAKASYIRSTDPIRIGFAQPQAVLIGADALDPSSFTQGPLVELAVAGASVMILRQRRIESLAGFEVVRRDPPGKLEWMPDHPLLRGFDETMLNALGRSSEINLALRLPSDEPVLAIAAWPRETPGISPVPIDAALISKTIGKGRIVLCQLPLTDYQHDPRSAMLVINAVDYLLSAPESILPPSKRQRIAQNIEQRTSTTITIPGGDQP